MEKKVFVASVIQAGSVGFNSKKTINKLADLTNDAKKKNSDLAVFPEAFIGGYPKGMHFGSSVGMRREYGRDEFLDYFSGAIEIPGPEVEQIALIAKKNKIYIVVGVIEKSFGTLYCSVLTFNSEGAYLGKRRKVMPTVAERIVWGFGDGSTLSVYKTKIGNIGSVICWENYMPMLRMALYSQNIQVYCAPTADDRDTWLPTMQTIALEGRCFVLSSNQFTTRSNFPSNYNFESNIKKGSVLQKGGSCIISPRGKILAGPIFSEECILTSEINLDEISKVKFEFDVSGHYSRPDIFHLSINKEKQNPTNISEI